MLLGRYVDSLSGTKNVDLELHYKDTADSACVACRKNISIRIPDLLLLTSES